MKTVIFAFVATMLLMSYFAPTVDSRIYPLIYTAVSVTCSAALGLGSYLLVALWHDIPSDIDNE